MPRPVLVTGGTGKLGRALVPRLLSAGCEVRVLSRRPQPVGDLSCEWATGDMRSGEGLDAAIAGVGTVVHCATSNGRGDVVGTGNLIEAARRNDRPHLLYLSIVGVDRVPLPYYRAKWESERLLEAADLPWTILRATQFHDLIASMCSVQRRLPALLMPAGVSFQPIDSGEVADRLAELVGAAPAARVPDIGGPEIRAATDLGRAWLTASGSRRPVVALRLPGAIFRQYRQGGHLTPDRTTGRVTFEDFLAGRRE